MLKQATWVWVLWLAAAGAGLLAGELAWKDKQIAEWSVDDARQVLTESPWAKTVTSTLDGTGRRSGVGMGRGGLEIGGIGIGLPGMGGMGGRGGNRGGGSRGGGPPEGDPSGRGGMDPGNAPTLRLRWESALPVRAAELKARETNAPAVVRITMPSRCMACPGA